MLSAMVGAAALFAPTMADAQSIWSREHLDNVKVSLDRPMYGEAYRALMARADKMLDAEPLSVMTKKRKTPSGDPHDYASIARYTHPNPNTPDGLPYVHRDGVTNPEIYEWDRGNLGTTANRVATLSLAYYLSGDERYAAKAAELLKVWFLNPATRMNPNLEYAQMVPGVDNWKGRSYGVIDAYSFVEMLDGVALLEGSKAWTKKDNKALQKWMSSMLDWMLTSKQGIQEANAANNHSVAFDAQAIALALYTGRDDLARKILEEFPEKRMFKQIEPDGWQPHEMRRTLSYHYSQYNLTHFIDIFLMGQKLGMKLDDRTDSEGRSFYKAMDILASYLGKDKSEWPGQQLSGWEAKQQDVARDLWRVATRLDTTRQDYKDLYLAHRLFNPSETFTLLYYTPDNTDDAYTRAAASLRHAIKCTDTDLRKEENASRRKVSPRTIAADGSLALVGAKDWCSGFFPGELWMMAEFTNDPYWRQEAVSHTWPIEEAKNHGGTHDLGFIIGDSFGKAWEQTGERSYFDVVKKTCNTLCGRFNPTVGAIRSWDHNPQKWKYPVIIDNMMNLEMLFKMSDETGDPRYRDIAVSHADVTLKNHFRPDKSSYHVVDYDPETGEVRMKMTHQGHADDSFWSRGQGWGIYGYTMCYRYTGDQKYLDQASGIADWFIDLPNMPADGIPYWDMKAPGTETPDNPDVARDASAASLIASGLYELADYVDDTRAEKYRNYADKVLASLYADYTYAPEEAQGFILAHSTGHHPAGSEIDVPLVYADYYYLEALARQRMKNANKKIFK